MNSLSWVSEDTVKCTRLLVFVDKYKTLNRAEIKICLYIVVKITEKPLKYVKITQIFILLKLEFCFHSEKLW